MIPKKIHYCWFGGKELPEEAKKCIESWKKYCPDYEIIQWNEKNYDINKNLYTKYTYENKKFAFLTDYVRLDIIYSEGGIYLDTDVELLKSLDDLLECDGYIGMEQTGTVNTGQGFGAIQGHPFIKENKEFYEKNDFLNEDGSFKRVICVKVSTDILKQNGLKEENKKQEIYGMTIYPTEFFCPLKMGTNKLNITENTYSIHYFNASWYTGNKFVKKFKYYLIPLKQFVKKNLVEKKVNKFNLFFKLIIMLMFFGAMHAVCTYMALAGAIVFAFLIGKYNLKKSSEDVCVGIMYLLTFQNLCIGLGAHWAGNTSPSLKYITQIPFATIAIIWLTNQFRYIKNGKYIADKTKKSFIFLLICIGISFIIGRGNIESILINIRNLTVFYMAFEIGKNNLSSEESIKKFVKRFLKLAIFVFVIGVILLIFGYNAYEMIGVHEVYLAKGAPLEGDKLDGRFNTTLIKRQYTRMGSIYYEPVNLAYFFSAAFLVSIFCDWTKSKKHKLITMLIMGLGLLLTFGKGGYLLVGSILLCLILQKILEKVLKRVDFQDIYKITICVILVCVSTLCVYYHKNIGAAVSPHFWGVIRTWKSVVAQPYGYGLGTGGNMAQIFNENPQSWFDTGGETALMSFVYQIGIQGGVALGICMYNISITKQRKGMGYFYKVFSFLPIILLGISLLQDNTFAPQCIVPFMLLQGGVKAIEQKI